MSHGVSRLVASKSSQAPISDFWGDYQFLAPGAWLLDNRPVRIECQGIVFKTLANALAALRTPDFTKRKEIAEMPSYQASQWAEGKPELSDPYHAEFMKHAVPWAIPLVAQRFGAMPSELDYGDKLEFGLKLLRTGNRPLIWVTHDHDQFFGKCGCSTHSKTCYTRDPELATGQNILGHIMMMVRRDLGLRFQGDLEGDNCTHCFNRCDGTITPGIEYILYWNEGLCREVACAKHISTVSKHAKRHAHKRRIFHREISKKSQAPQTPYGSYWEGDDDEWEASWGCAAPSHTYTPSKKYWNVITFVPGSSEGLVEDVLESK